MERSGWIAESCATSVHLAHSLRRHYPDQVHGVDGDVSRPLSRDFPSSPGTFIRAKKNRKFRVNSRLANYVPRFVGELPLDRLAGFIEAGFQSSFVCVVGDRMTCLTPCCEYGSR